MSDDGRMLDDERIEPLSMTIQRTAENHLEACVEVMDAEEDEDGEPVDSPAFGPFCGCTTCIVREVLASSWEMLCVAAELEVETAIHQADERYVTERSEQAVRAVSRELADRLRTEAERANAAEKGRHPEIKVQTHAAALRYAAMVVEGKA